MPLWLAELVACVAPLLGGRVVAVVARAHPLLSEENGRTVPAKIIMDAHNELTNFFKVTTLEDAPYTQKILADKHDPVEIQEAKSIMR